MNLSSKAVIKKLLKSYGRRPIKWLGQNFLIDKRVLKKIAASSQLSPQDIVLEIGPGIGTLTQELAKKAKKVIAVEKDRTMIEILKETLKDFENVEIVQGDILRSKLQLPKNYKIVGNLPFYITAPVIRQFLELTEARPQSMMLVVQKEVGQRICSKPPKMNLLAVAVQFYADAKINFYVSKKSFWPQPKVNAAVIKITPQPSLIEDNETFFKIVKAGFKQPRKQLINNLSKGLKMSREKVQSWLQKNKVFPIQRAETLSLDDWLNLTKTFVV